MKTTDELLDFILNQDSKIDKLNSTIIEQADKIAVLDGQVKELSGLIYNNALGNVTMGYSVDIESMAQHTYQITGINAEGKSKGEAHE